MGIFIFVSLFTFFDYFYSFIFPKKSFHFSCSRFFKIFIIFPKMCCFFLPIFSKLSNICDMILSFIIINNCYYLIIYFSPINKFHHSNNTKLNKCSRKYVFCKIYNFYIKWIIIQIPSRWNCSIGKWIYKRRIPNSIKFQCSGFCNKLILIYKLCIIFNYCIYYSFFL